MIFGGHQGGTQEKISKGEHFIKVSTSWEVPRAEPLDVGKGLKIG